MKIIKQTSPYIHKKVSVERMMFDVMIALWPLAIFAVIGNGFKALSVLLLSIVTMVISEFVFLYMTSKEPYDGSNKTFKYNVLTVTCNQDELVKKNLKFSTPTKGLPKNPFTGS